MAAKTYAAVLNDFVQDDPQALHQAIGALPARFGLKEDSPDRWEIFMSKVSRLNREAKNGTKYKVFFFLRHGEGYHNVAKVKYGEKDWDNYWTKLDGDAEYTWADADLTDTGKAQAQMTCALWNAELGFGMPLPGKLYCSPLTRALRTQTITFGGIKFNGSLPKTMILENCREEYGEHTCDKRRSRSVIETEFFHAHSRVDFEFEDGFKENDELWTVEKESEVHTTSRAKAVLDRIFDEDTEEFISIMGHYGIINAFLRTLGRQRYYLPAGGVLPVVIKQTM
jgi:broad specificity phosphatase PhoE